MLNITKIAFEKFVNQYCADKYQNLIITRQHIRGLGAVIGKCCL